MLTGQIFSLGKRYQTLSIGYIITRGLQNLLLQPSSNPQGHIENIIKKYLYDAFQYHFDKKLSADQKEAMLVCLLTFLLAFLFMKFLFQLNRSMNIFFENEYFEKLFLK